MKKIWRVINDLQRLGNGFHAKSELEKFDGRDIIEIELMGMIEYSKTGTWRLINLKRK